MRKINNLAALPNDSSTDLFHTITQVLSIIQTSGMQVWFWACSE